MAQCSAEHVFGGGLSGDPSGLGGHRGVARLHHSLQGAALMRGIAFHCFDQVGDEVVALLGLHVDVGEGLVDPLPHGNEAVVDHDDPSEQNDDHTDDDPGDGGGRHGVRLLGGSLAKI